MTDQIFSITGTRSCSMLHEIFSIFSELCCYPRRIQFSNILLRHPDQPEAKKFHNIRKHIAHHLRCGNKKTALTGMFLTRFLCFSLITYSDKAQSFISQIAEPSLLIHFGGAFGLFWYKNRINAARTEPIKLVFCSSSLHSPYPFPTLQLLHLCPHQSKNSSTIFVIRNIKKGIKTFVHFPTAEYCLKSGYCSTTRRRIERSPSTCSLLASWREIISTSSKT